MKRILILFIFLSGILISGTSNAQSAGDYRTVANGNWSTPTVWERYNGTAWLPASAPPTFADGVITISNVIHQNINQELDQVVIAPSATLFADSCTRWRFATGGSLDVFGQYIINALCGGADCGGTCGSIRVRSGGMMSMNQGDLNVNIQIDLGGTLDLNKFQMNLNGIIDNSGTVNVNMPVNSFSNYINNGTFGGAQPIRFAGSSTQQIGGTGSFNSIILDNPNGFQIGGDQTINDSIRLITGKVITGASKLIIGPTGTILGASPGSYIWGNLELTITSSIQYQFPVGDADSYAPIVLINPDVLTSGGVVARTDPGDHPDIGNSGIDPSKSVNRYWSMQSTGASVGDYLLSLTWPPVDLDPGTDTQNLDAAQNDDGSWTIKADDGYDDNTSTLVGIECSGDFGEFVVGNQGLGCVPTGEFRSVADGNWDDETIWETYNGCTWVPATSAPDATTASFITISDGTIVSITSPKSIDETYVENGGTLNVQSDIEVLDGPDDDLEIQGLVNWFSGDLDIASGASITGTDFTFKGNNLTIFGSISNNTFVMAGGSTQTILGNGVISTLLPFNSGNIELEGDLTITSQLAFNQGKIITNSSKLIMGEDAFIINADASMYVVGNLEFGYAATGTKFFPVGDDDTYAPLSLFADITFPGGIIARTDAGDHSEINSSTINPDKSVNRTWHLDNDGAEFDDYSVDVQWALSDVDAGADFNNFGISKYDSPNWEVLSPSNRTATSITGSFLGQTFSDFQVGEPTCIVSIPDVNFKNALLSNPLINTNFDGEIQCYEAADFSGVINVQSENISDLTGIEAFIHLGELNCAHNQLTSVNTSTLADITFLDCSFNSITSVDLTANTLLTNLYLQNNNIGTVNLAGLSSLQQFDIDNNVLTELDASPITSIQYLSCGNNLLSELDASMLTSLNQLYCYSNQLTSLNIQNGNNFNLADFDATNNPDLSCIQVDDVAFMDANWSGAKPPSASYSLSCGPCQSGVSWIEGPTTACEGSTVELFVGEVAQLNDNTDYVWYTDSCGGTQIATGFFIDVTPTTTTTYYLRTEGGCAPPGACYSQTVTVNPAPNITFDVSSVGFSCANSDDGQITVTNVSGGTPPYAYSVDGNDFFNSNSDGIFNDLPQYANPFTVHVADASGCNSTHEETVNLGVQNQLHLAVVPASAIVCPGGTINVSLVATGGNGVYDYILDNDDTVGIGAGTHFYSVESDGGDCGTLSAQSHINIFQNPGPDTYITQTGVITSCLDDSLTLSVPSPATYALSFDGNDDYAEDGFTFAPTNNASRTFQHIGILSLEFHVDKLSRPLL